MIEGVFKVSFATPLARGEGVVILSDGKVAGGDSAMYYVGTYGQDGNSFVANVRTGRHTTNPSLQNVFGADNVRISISGTVAGTTINGKGQSPDAPGLSFTANLTKVADL
jgi:hypothetical protein